MPAKFNKEIHNSLVAIVFTSLLTLDVLWPNILANKIMLLWTAAQYEGKP